MPSSQSSLSVTEAYRTRMVALRTQVEQTASQGWSRLDLSGGGFDAGYERWRSDTARAVTAVQRQGARLSAAYLAAFLSSELGHRVRTPGVETTRYAGLSRDGRNLTDAYASPRIGVLAALKDGLSESEALARGRTRALRAVGLDSDTAVRSSLSDLMAVDERIEGWRRAVKGTCDACLGAAEASLASAGTPLQIHPNCACVSEPAVRSVSITVARPTGQQRLDAMSPQEQDAQFGPEIARLLREGRIELQDLVAVRKLASAENFISAASVGEALANATKRKST